MQNLKYTADKNACSQSLGTVQHFFAILVAMKVGEAKQTQS
jgi:hypothetical protein